MAWTSPMTAIVGAVLTASQWNASVRDNLLETAVAKATTPGGFFVSTGSNALAERVPTTASVNSDHTTSSTTYVSLAGGPSVTVTTGTMALVFITARTRNDTTSFACHMGFSISGATSRIAAEETGLRFESAGISEFDRATAVSLETGLNPGTNTFTTQYKVAGGTGSFYARSIIVVPF